jgi:hypothetical protein
MLPYYANMCNGKLFCTLFGKGASAGNSYERIGAIAATGRK